MERYTYSPKEIILYFNDQIMSIRIKTCHSRNLDFVFPTNLHDFIGQALDDVFTTIPDKKEIESNTKICFSNGIYQFFYHYRCQECGEFLKEFDLKYLGEDSGSETSSDS